MTTYLKKWNSYALEDDNPLSDADKAYFRARTRRHIHTVVLEKFSELSDDNLVSRAKLAHKLNVDRSQVTRWIANPGNWTLDTLSDLLLAMSCQVSLSSPAIADQTRRNYYHPESTSKGAEKIVTSGLANGPETLVQNTSSTGTSSYRLNLPTSSDASNNPER